MIEIKAADLQAPPSIAALQNKALGIGLVGMAASIAGYLSDPKAATESYLLAFIYWIAFPLGSLGLMMVHHLSGGGWGMPVRRIGMPQPPPDRWWTIIRPSEPSGNAIQ